MVGPGLTTLAQVLGRRPGFDRVVEALTAGLAEALGMPLVPGGLSADESALVDALVAEKYGTEAWTALGRLPAVIEAPPAPADAPR